MSALERLAKLRAAKNQEQNTANLSSIDESKLHKSSRSIGLLSKLQTEDGLKNRTDMAGSTELLVKKQSLSEKFAAIKKARQEKENTLSQNTPTFESTNNLITINNETSTSSRLNKFEKFQTTNDAKLKQNQPSSDISLISTPNNVRLSLKLTAIRKSQGFELRNKDNTVLNKNRTNNKSHLHGSQTSEMDPSTKNPIMLHDKIKNSRLIWNLISQQNLRSHSNSGYIFKTQSSIINNSKLNEICINNSKRSRCSNQYTVFYPNKKHNVYLSKDQIKKNFEKPSPDDIVLEAQAKAFVDVTQKVSKLKIDKTLEEQKKKEEEEKKRMESIKQVFIPSEPYQAIEIDNYVKKNDIKSINILIMGDTGSGKSTLMGRLIQDFNLLDYDTIRRIKWDSEKHLKSTNYLAWLVDKSKNERQSGSSLFPHTIEIHKRNLFLDNELNSTAYNINEIPGNKSYVSKARTWVFNSNLIVICIDCNIESFEKGFSLDGQTRDHILLTKTMGIKYLIFAMNKMDTVEWDEVRFMSIKNELTVFLKDIQFKHVENVSWIPISGRTGEGVHNVDYPKQMKWYEGGASLFSTIEKLTIHKYDNISKKPFIFQILKRKMHESDKHATLITGKVINGTIQPGENITVYPSKQSLIVDRISSTVDSIKNAPLPIALESDSVTLKVLNADYQSISIGNIATSVDFNLETSNSFQIKIKTLYMNEHLQVGDLMTVYSGFSRYGVKITEILSNDIIPVNKSHIGSDEIATFSLDVIEPDHDIPILIHLANNPMALNEVIFRRQGAFVAIGRFIQ
ncbi:hypothetical protein TBLA_0I01600 [Henningerozyma blattae CBS 6284]|uniref:Tr-type G domain-containing protein n=1 Tax=Henningerozyma blattae (strain ATCC 34711 / CBS 6284 / DSM 70876 / NBRC 10599 / NRRL Y-10934 / UCD 77-7) TaxID=1071380 RepID=I2H8W6_HENB6|nr:hypothetical protein TBLA_0I01600 [Tetrapisispora blattae CBS 6284]CCH62818.1 hypothetical protein TBLA_0I01600 [Tetrapisispora blattae CBS 6284]